MNPFIESIENVN